MRNRSFAVVCLSLLQVLLKLVLDFFAIATRSVQAFLFVAGWRSFVFVFAISVGSTYLYF